MSLNGESQQGEDADADGQGWSEGVDAAVDWTKNPVSETSTVNLYNYGYPALQPLPVPHEDEAGDAVEGGHPQVCQDKVHQEVVRQAPHAPVSWK